MLGNPADFVRNFLPLRASYRKGRANWLELAKGIKMKPVLMILAMIGLSVTAGCTTIETVTPAAGPAGSTVYLKTGGIWGDPAANHVKWDGKTVCSPFWGSFTVPAVCEPGPHKITLVDRLDASEAFLLFPIFRLRHDSIIFTVTEH